ncbi:type II secretion system F family protein [Parasedimentitalea marina]|uniref:Type II secretion system F family protein n=1 Tax=Parasedimentitalea marina TaxID=2483033 RepID=A0A3T0N8N5_9RHOB|nr:type II secretion system F family protein [Parasedimentitalea marina]AZV80390.1 type II secretion system F family protein [Parasedimentitalea marina]
MEHLVTDLITRSGLSESTFIMIGFGTAALLLYGAIAGFLARNNPTTTRIAALHPSASRIRQDKGLLMPLDKNSGGFIKAFVPSDKRERTELTNKLAQAGFSQSGALRSFFLIRALLGLVLPAMLLLLVSLSRASELLPPNPVSMTIGDWTNLQVFQCLMALIGCGYFGPLYLLNARVAGRRRRIEEAFPNALDLMRISVGSGLGFDAAMTRVGNEMTSAAPELAFEFLSVQRQIQAGRPREEALLDLSDRTGVGTIRSFANVALQSMQFGTSMATALSTYSEDLRDQREVRAQEMANKLPVKMSAVLASLMLPALILLTVGPVVIRYIRFFSA